MLKGYGQLRNLLWLGSFGHHVVMIYVRWYETVKHNLPFTAIAPALAADKAALAVPVGRVRRSIAVVALDVAAALGPVLEVVAALARVDGALRQSLRARKGGGEHSGRAAEAGREERKVHHVDRLVLNGRKVREGLGW